MGIATAPTTRRAKTQSAFPRGGGAAAATAPPPDRGPSTLAPSDPYELGQLLSMSLRMPSRELGPSFMYLTIPVQKLPDPTAAGIRSEASNRAVPAVRPSLSTAAESARISFA